MDDSKKMESSVAPTKETDYRTKYEAILKKQELDKNQYDDLNLKFNKLFQAYSNLLNLFLDNK